jgi:4-amino-4-deoxy-L-arabinose transferase-like glycosyltransferase
MTSPSHTFLRWLALLLLVNVAVRLPLCWEPAAVRNDGAEYLAVARSLRTTGEYATDLKYQFFTDDPVRHPAWGDRPPLYPAFAALCALALPGLDPTAAARLGNVLVAAIALVLAAFYLRRLYGEKVALLAAGYVFLLPHTVYWTAQPMTESLSLLLTFGGLLVWHPPVQALTCPTTQHPPSRRSGLPLSRSVGEGGTGDEGPPSTQHSTPTRALLAGMLAGLGYLTRPTGALLALVFALDALWRLGKGRLVTLAALAVGFLLCAVPYHLVLWRVHGSPFYSSIGYTFSVENYYAVTYYGFERQHATTPEFLRGHAGELPRLILAQAWNHAQSLFLPLAALWPFAVRWRRADWSGDHFPAAALIAAVVVVHTLVWSAWGSSRYFLIPLILLTAALLDAAVSRQPSAVSPQPSVSQQPHSPHGFRLSPFAFRLSIAASAVGLLISLGQLYLREARPDHGLPLLPDWKSAAVEVRDAALIASDRPATLNLLTEKPCVMLPRMTDPAQMERFVRKFQPNVMVLFIDEPEKPSAEAMAAAWRSGALPAGWRLVTDRGRTLIARRASTASGLPRLSR